MKVPILIAAIAACAALPVNSEPLVNESAQSTSAVKITPTSHQRLADIKTVFVAPFGTAEGSELIRQKVIHKLIKNGMLAVVESPELADAVLTGVAEMDHHNYFTVTNGNASSGTKYRAEGIVRLIGKEKQVLWLDELSSRKFFPSHTAKGASSNVSDKIANGVLQAVEAAKTEIASQKSTEL